MPFHISTQYGMAEIPSQNLIVYEIHSWQGCMQLHFKPDFLGQQNWDMRESVAFALKSEWYEGSSKCLCFAQLNDCVSTRAGSFAYTAERLQSKLFQAVFAGARDVAACTVFSVHVCLPDGGWIKATWYSVGNHCWGSLDPASGSVVSEATLSCLTPWVLWGSFMHQFLGRNEETGPRSYTGRPGNVVFCSVWFCLF